MSNFLHIIFVILVNFIGWGMLVAGVIGFIGYFGIMLTDKPSGRNPNDPASGSGMPWG